MGAELYRYTNRTDRVKLFPPHLRDAHKAVGVKRPRAGPSKAPVRVTWADDVGGGVDDFLAGGGEAEEEYDFGIDSAGDEALLAAAGMVF